MKLLLHWISIVSADFSIMSLYFYACLALFALVYYTIAQKLKVQWAFILAASIFFLFFKLKREVVFMATCTNNIYLFNGVYHK